MNDFNSDEKLLQLFHILYGEYSNKFTIEVTDPYSDIYGVRVTNDNGPCGFYSREDLMFEWICKMLPPTIQGVEPPKNDKYVLIKIKESELSKIKDFEIVDKDLELREHIKHYSNIGDLYDWEVDNIIEEIHAARGSGYKGVVVDVELGRCPSTDERTYRLDSVNMSNDEVDMTIDEVRHLL